MSNLRPAPCSLLLLLLGTVVLSIKASDFKPQLHALRYQQQFKDLNKAIELNNEGMELSHQGRYEQAHKKLTKSLEIKERLHGHDTTMVALSLMNLGDNYLAWGKYDEAEEAGREALRIRRAEKDPEAKYAEELLDDIRKARLRTGRMQGAPPTAKSSSVSKKSSAAGASSSKKRKTGSRSSSSSAAGAVGPSSSERTPPRRLAAEVAMGIALSTAIAAASAAAAAAVRRFSSSDTGKTATCAGCGTIGATKYANATRSKPYLKKCSNCRAVYYCSKDCQHRDWPRHKAACKAAKRR